LHELRRGSEYAQISCIAFDSNWLACSSDTCTVHVFSLKDAPKETKSEIPDSPEGKVKVVENPRSKFAFMKVISTYFNSEWSFAQFRIKDRKAKLVFGDEPCSIYVAGCDGLYYSITFDPINGGECTKKSEGSLSEVSDQF